MAWAMRFLMLPAALLLGACGGGGGGGGGAVAFSGFGASFTASPADGAGAGNASAGGAPSSTSAPPPAPSSAGSSGAPPAAGGGAAPAPPSTPMSFKTTELAADLVAPWSLAFLPDGRMLISQRLGQLRLRNADGSAANGGNDAIGGLPAVDTGGQGGLLDVAVDPGFSQNRRVYFSFSERDAAQPSLNGTAVARAELDLSTRNLSNLVVIYRQLPKVASSGHFGSRLAFDGAGRLFVTLGDRQLDSQRGFAQDLSRGHGKVVRITTDGAPAPGNPFVATPGAQPEIWSLGHRNPQGAAIHPSTGELWISEHGPQGGDEVNIARAGRNYGWPLISHGQEYGTLSPVGQGSAAPGLEQPVSYWETFDGSPWIAGTQKSSIAPSGLAFYTADALPAWKGSLFVGALAGTALWRLSLGGDTVTARERLLASRGERIRDVRQGPDGWLYLLTDGTPGKLLRIER